MQIGIGRSDHNLWSVGACLAACVSFFIWASGHGYDINDESYYLLWDSAPFSLHFSVSRFGYFWHPIYKLVGGNIALLRIAGASILVACSATFAFALQKFIDFRSGSGNERYLIVLSISTSAFWFYCTWLSVPGYNLLNLCALLLFFSGLLAATEGATKVGASDRWQTIGPAILSGVSLGVMALVKPTTWAAAIVLGVAWLVLLRPPRTSVFIAVLAVSSAVMLSISILLIDGSLSVFLDNLLSSLAILRLQDHPGDVHGIVNSVLGPFERDRVWKIFPAIALGIAILCVCIGIVSTMLGLMKINHRLQKIISYGLVAALAIFIAMARAVDLQLPIPWYNYHAWYFSFLILACAIAIVLARTKFIEWDGWQRRAIAAALVALAPIAYSFGSNVTILRHMVAASVFWAGTTMLICSLASSVQRKQLFGITAVLCGMATIGLFAGLVLAPIGSEAPLMQQTEAVTVGPDGARLLVDRTTADYIRSFQRAAVGAGFEPGTPVVDLTEFGPGIVFALSGSAPGLPWLADNPDGSMTVALAVLKTIPKSELQRAWIITGSSRNFSNIRTALNAVGLNFPAAYHVVVAAKLDAFGWQHSLWKPATH